MLRLNNRDSIEPSLRVDKVRKRLTAVLSLVVWLGVVPCSRAVDCDSLPPRTPVTLDSVHVFQYGDGSAFTGNDCWGWISPEGIEYAIYGAEDGIAFLNINTMTEAAFVPRSSCIEGDFKTYRNYCYVAGLCPTDGTLIYDMQYLPDSVHYVGNYAHRNSPNSHNISIDTATATLYF